jgi:hypothetical protein
MGETDRRRFVTGLLAGVGLSGASLNDGRAQSPAGVREATIVDSVKPPPPGVTRNGPEGVVRIGEFNVVGQYDIDWLLEPSLQRLLDYMAASPTGFGGVRFFHALDSGTRANTIDDDPLDGGAVWPAPGVSIDFSRTFAALATLTARGLTPFVGLNFFPRAISRIAKAPPDTFTNWGILIRRFLDDLAADPRFGPSAIRDWHFEVWNEPNNAAFWSGRYNPQYFDLYRATAQAVRASGHTIRLGGPAIVYRRGTEASRREMRDFLQFLSAEPDLQCDFISLHAKGSWSSSGEPEFTDLVEAVAETASLARAIDPKRFAGVAIVNDEADMRVGFNIPFEARMSERYAAWMCAVAIAYDTLSARFADMRLRFHAASDNANLQLVRASFDGRRSIATRASAAAGDLIKLPVFNFYEILRLLGDRHGSILAGAENLFPETELFHLVSTADDHIACLFCIYSRKSSERAHPWRLDYTITDIPWARINVARFRIDAEHSNAYAAAGLARHANPFPATDELRKIRAAQELALASPIAREVAGGTVRETLTMEPFAVAAYWITPHIPDRPAEPVWIEAHLEDGNVILRWRPNTEPFFYSYEVYAIVAGGEPRLISPEPLRSAILIDTAPAKGTRIYAVRSVTASGVRSDLVHSDPVAI